MKLRAAFLGLSLLLAARSASAATCTLGEHAGFEDAEAKTATGIVCHELVAREPRGNFEVRLGKLSGRTLVTVAEGADGAREVRTFVSGLDELDVAAPRLATSLIEARPLADTRTVDSVLAEEGRAEKKVASTVGATMGMYVLSSVGMQSAASAGVDVGLAFRTRYLGLSADGRLGGVGSGSTKIGNSSLDVGARLYMTNGDVAPFIGGGVGMSNFHRNALGTSGDRSGSGPEAFATIGVEALRSSHAGLLVGLRVDLPFYQLESGGLGPKSSAYVAPLSLNIALAFH